MSLAPLLAHQGGWDEILMVVGPLALVAFLLRMANRRITAQLEEAEGQDDAGGGSSGGGTGADPANRTEDPSNTEGSSGTDSRS